MQTERVTILMTPAKKAELVARAAARHMSLGQYVRDKVEDNEELTPQQEAELAVLVAQANEAIPQMAASLDRMIDSVRETREDIQRTLRSLSAQS